VPKTTKTFEKWAVLWSGASADGNPYFIFEESRPAEFRTRNEARQFITEQYGFIRRRPDLRRPPHSWRMPRAVKVRVTMEEM
jgi:hypothetical protein